MNSSPPSESGAKVTAVQTLTRLPSVLELREEFWTAARSPPLSDVPPLEDLGKGLFTLYKDFAPTARVGIVTKRAHTALAAGQRQPD